MLLFVFPEFSFNFRPQIYYLKQILSILLSSQLFNKQDYEFPTVTSVANC